MSQPVPQLSVEDAYNIIATVIQDAPVPLKDHQVVTLALNIVAQFIVDNREQTAQAVERIPPQVEQDA